jgi:protein disulfide isomerase family A protein 3
VTVAAMDATANDPPAGYEIEGYPTLVFLRASDKSKKIPYDGPRDAKSMVEFIKAQKSK